jgi:probable HAF family extracellular repeat protein
MNWIRLTAYVIASGFASAGPIYTLADLGTLNGSSILASGINSFGQVTGTVTSIFGNMQAFDSDGSSLNGLTNGGSITQSEASAINDGGQVAGTQYFGNQTYATIWNDGVATTLGGAGSFATSINSNGDVAGMIVNNGQGNAFVSQNGTVIDLGTIGGGSWSAAYGVNDSGQAVGYGMTSGGSFRGFVWTPGQGYTVLGTLGGANSYAMAISNTGFIAGSSQSAIGYSHAFLSNGSSMQDLGTLGGVASYGYGINNLGNVVGSSWTAGNAGTDGFLYENGVMWDINALLIDAPGWQVTALYGINDSNQVVGVGMLNGIEHAVLLTDPPPPGVSSDQQSSTPEPAVWICTFTGLAVLLFRKYRKGSIQ